MDLENIMSIMSNLENNTSPKIYLYPAKILQVRKYGLRKYYKLPEIIILQKYYKLFEIIKSENLYFTIYDNVINDNTWKTQRYD